MTSNSLTRRSLLRAASLGAAAAIISPRAANAAEEIKLTVSAAHAPIFPWVKAITEVLIPSVDNELAAGGKYKIVWTEAYGGALAKVGSELETIEQGISDMGIVNTLFHADRMPLQNISYVTPFGPNDPAVLQKVMRRLNDEVPAMKEAWARANQVFLTQYGADSYQVMSDEPILTADDFIGRKIAGPPIALPWLQGSGAVGVVGSLPAYYNDLKSGLYSGVLSVASTTKPIKLYEVAPNLTVMNMGATVGGGVTVNLDRWNTLPVEVKTALQNGADAWLETMYADITERTLAAMEAYREHGSVFEMAPEEVKKFADSIVNPTTAWVAQAESQGLPAKEVLSTYMDTMRSEGVAFARDWDKE